VLTDNYRLINLIFAGIIIAVIAYSALFGGEWKHPLPSGSGLLTGGKSISTGLSRSFSAIVRFDFDASGQYNRYGIRIFIFMLIQLAMRLTGLFIGSHSLRRQIILTDISVSIILFLIFFYPFLKNLYQEL
jgi:hypothetical protein